jgi:hypothetical protein
MDLKTECLEVERWENEGGQPLTEVELKQARNFKSKEKKEERRESMRVETARGKLPRIRS